MRDVLARAVRVVRGHALDELVEVVELDVALHERADHLGALARDLRADVDEDRGAGPLGALREQRHRDHAAHRVAHDERPLQPQLVDERERVLGHRRRRVVGVARPLAVVVAALVDREHVVAVGEVQADEVPGVRGLVAAVEQQQRRRAGLAPLEEVEALVPQHRVARAVAQLGRVWDAEVGRALEQRAQLRRGAQVERIEAGGELVQVHRGLHQGRHRGRHRGRVAPMLTTPRRGRARRGSRSARRAACACARRSRPGWRSRRRPAAG